MSSEPYDPYIPNGQGSQGGHSQDPKTVDLQRQIEETRNALNKTVKSLGDRGEHLDGLQDKTRDLADRSADFRRSSNKVRKKMWWNEMKMRIWLGIGIVVLLIIIIVPAVVTTRGK